jgi:hypothetical protein
LIRAEKLENLIPEILMQSEHLYFILMDVEGIVLNSNKIFLTVAPNSIKQTFVSNLSDNSKKEFSEILFELLSAPKEKKRLPLDIINGENEIRIYWEFSVITSPEMDFMGIMGIGIGTEFQVLRNQFPWKNLSDVLDFSKVTLNDEFQVIEIDDSFCEWLGIENQAIIGENIFQTYLFPSDSDDQKKINQFKRDKSPCVLLLYNPENQNEYTGILTSAKNDFQLFILPKIFVSNKKSLKKPFNKVQLSSLPGSIWIVDQELKLIQQNKSGIILSKAWNGKAFEENDILYFSQRIGKFANFIERVKYCLNTGNSIELDIQLKTSSSEFGFWKANVKAMKDSNGKIVAAFIQIIDNSAWGKKILELQSENEKLKELALRPSHILRSPLSSMLGLLDLIDSNQLNPENLKYFSYLKPLAKELDDVIRSNAKKVSVFD